jgi:hypothetical protein
MIISRGKSKELREKSAPLFTMNLTLTPLGLNLNLQSEDSVYRLNLRDERMEHILLFSFILILFIGL